MKEILAGNDFVKNILKSWKIDKEVFYVPSKFNVIIDDEPFLLHNTLTRTLVQINEEEKNILTGGKIYYNDNILNLIQANYLVPENINEISVAEQTLSLVRNLKPQSNAIKLYTILTTTDCNARCFYCYEAGIKKNNMTEGTAHKIVEFIKDNHGEEEVRLNWFGGEPLYNNKVIDIICNGLAEKNIKYCSTMTSNGYLFDAELIKKSVELWNLKEVQITLDGTEQIYNRVKNYIYNDNISPFKKVCDNIEQLLANKIKVKIRLNLDHHNDSDLFELVKYINNRFADKKYLFAYVSLLFDLDGTKSITEKIYLSKIKNEIEEFLNKNGMFGSGLKNHLPVNHCMADSDESTLINPDGGLAKCEHYPYDITYGSIYEPQKIDKENILLWKKPRPKVPECNNCKVFPMCFWPEKCLESGHNCDEADRYIYESNVKKHMRYEWRKSLEENSVSE